MKVIPKDDLITMLNSMDGPFYRDTIERIFDKYGDDYYKDPGYSPYELCNENQERKALLGRKT